MGDNIIRRNDGFHIYKRESYQKGDLSYAVNRVITAQGEQKSCRGKLLPKSRYERIDEAITQARRKLVRAGIDSVKKSGAAMLNTFSLGSYQRYRQTKVRKGMIRKQSVTDDGTSNKSLVSKKSGIISGRKRRNSRHLGNTVTRTIAISTVNDIQPGGQENLNSSAQIALSLMIKMIAMTLMAVKIAVKLALLVVTAALSLVVVAVSSIAGIIIAIVVVVVLIATVVSMVASDTNGDDSEVGRIGMYSYESVYSDLEKQYENKIISLVDIGRNAGCESYQIEGEKADAEDVLAVYLAADTANGYGTFDADTLWFVIDANGINLLTEIYWRMNEIEYSIEADESVPKKMLIKATAKDREIAAGEYNAENQLESVSAHYFHLFNMIRNAEQDRRYVLPIGEKSY
ncbi:MAG: hypothetical protein J6O61_01440 [Butyrivibrio sp.]|uniref:hypothetical protein n=1 Tax=Butyrivibrio sp. TaxID=28121 RepID=UPI001B29DD02|nr:hypothetical protein [Butyrivibrio sp.]MBO6239497.1 hypothetical protein [Butyrivibrio sp.]MBP3239102.1 hypothetical protein [Oribacterium sp.]